MQRKTLDPVLEELKPLFVKVFEKLESLTKGQAYPSLMVEKRWKREFAVQPQGEQLNENLSFGWILRLFQGQTLLEEAGDDFSEMSLMAAVERLQRDQEALYRSGEKSEVVYSSPSWRERRQLNLESEILTQIPDAVEASSWVHFGSQMQRPLPSGNEELMSFAKEKYKGALKLLDQKFSKLKPFDYSLLRVTLENVDMLFMDSSVRMTQSLPRNSAVFAVSKSGRRGHTLYGGLGGLESIDIQEREFEEAGERLQKCLEAGRIQPGRYKVVLSPSMTGVFAHEAFGHSQEGDTWARNRSKAKELYEKQTRVGNDYATILNNPAVYWNGSDPFAAWGSYFFDEEGWLAQSHVLVERGYLKSPMTNLTSAIRLNVPRTANGKRENWSHGMYTRQTNTYFAPGNLTLQELLEKVDYGFLASTAFGGMEDPKGMGIQVGMAFVEEIEDGKLTGKSFVAPNGGALQMTGYVPDYLESILAVSKIDAHTPGADESTHPWNEIGGCGKYHKEYVVAGCGGPYMLLDQVLLG